MVSSEYAYFAPQSQHTRYVSREDTTKVSVVTSKEEIANDYEGRHKRSFVVLALPA
jgi:hypothetical protein